MVDFEGNNLLEESNVFSRPRFSALQRGAFKHFEQPLMENRFALEKLTSTNLTPLVSGDVLESWDFLLHFREKLSLQNGLSLEDLITGLNEPFFHGLSKAHIRMLQELINEFSKKPKHGRKRCVRCSTECTMTELNMPPLNDLTWPELAKKYILAKLFVTEDPKNSDKACARMDIFQCLFGDGGPKCGALTGLVGLEEDALLLAASTNRIYGSLNGGMLAVDDLDSDKKNTGLGQSTVLNERIPRWVQDLELIKGLKTNNGAKIKKCINDSLKNNPEKWAMDILLHSISNKVYKGNASGPTKKLALHVVAEFNAGQNLNPGRNKKKHISISDVVMKYCRIMLRLVCASEKIINFCKFVELANNKKEGIFGSPAKVSSLLYFRMIDMRLVAGAYCGSHDAFIEDVREFWRDVQIDFPKLSKNAKEASDEFESSCIKEVVALHRKLEKYKKLESISADILNDIENIVHRCDKKVPKAPWDGVICKVCGIDQHNKKVLLCDKCDAGYYHTYCLTPPLKRVPKGTWFCPRCVANKDEEDAFHIATPISQSQEKKNVEFVSFIHSKLTDLEAMVRGKDYWELNFHERTLLLKFLCNEMLDTKLVRRHWSECESHQQCTSIEGSVTTEFMGIDFNGKLYWRIDDDITPSIVVNYCTEVTQSDPTFEVLPRSCIPSDMEYLWSPKGSEMYSLGNLCQSHAAIKSIVASLKDNDPIKRRLEELVLLSYKSELDIPKECKGEGHKALQINPMSSDDLKAKATKRLELKYGQFIKHGIIDFGKKNKEKEVEGNLRRCECLQPLLPTGQHCLSCHRTCFTTMKKKLHGNGKCIIERRKIGISSCGERTTNPMASKGKEQICQDDCVPPNSPLVDIGVEVDERRRLDKPKPAGSNVPAASELPLVGEASQILTKLKINLLDMEAAISGNALKPSRSGIERIWAWRLFVWQAGTIFEMVRAQIVFEDMIKPEYLDCSWRYNWSSLSAADNISTLAALSLRIYSLDAAIKYEKIECTSNSHGQIVGRVKQARNGKEEKLEKQERQNLRTKW